MRKPRRNHSAAFKARVEVWILHCSEAVIGERRFRAES
jgi:hypothetical protein